MDDFFAQIAVLDGIITVANSTAHVAGSLGVSCSVVLPFVPSFRWGISEKNVWYASVSTYRQSKNLEKSLLFNNLYDCLLYTSDAADES